MNKHVAIAIVHAPGLVDLNPGAGLADLPVGSHDLFPVATMGVDLEKFKGHSITLNSMVWRMAELLGDVGSGDTEARVEPTEVFDRFLASATASAEKIAAQAQRIADLESAIAARAPTDISTRLREYAGNPGYSHGDYADTMRIAADECERFHGGMVAWKQTAQAKDRLIIEARAALAGSATPSPETVEAVAGTAVLTKDGLIADFAPAKAEFFGAVIDGRTIDDANLKMRDFNYAGLAPHRAVSLYFGHPVSPAVQKDSERLQFMLDEGAIVDSANSKSGMRYWLVWTACGSLQSDDYASQREAIDAAIAAQKGGAA